MPLNHPSNLIDPKDSLLSRQVQDLLKSLKPLFDGATQADKDWTSLEMRSPWKNWGDMKASCRTLLSGAFTMKGMISTIGGQSSMLKAAAGAVDVSSYVTILDAKSAPVAVPILTLPVKPAEDFYLPYQAMFAYDSSKKPFYAAALLSVAKKDGTLSLVGLAGRADTTVAIAWMQLEFMRVM